MAEKIGASGLRRVELEEKMRSIGNLLGEAIPDGTGFAFLLFDFGGPGNMAYMSNAQRDDMIAALEELLAKLRPS